jgi:hypothetical protein
VGHAPILGHGHAAGASQNDTTPAPTDGGSIQHGFGDALKSAALLFISPMDVCSILLGTGVVGFVLEHFMREGRLLFCFALLGGIIFDLGVTRTIMSLAFRFAGSPSEGLEGAVAMTAKAVTGFDQEGMGLVEIILDGQASQLLATLDPSEVQSGTVVHRGDALLILEVDSHRNVCKVSRDLAPTGG